jgi:pimeloyl-ACP methyl ester carboxylesterase
LAHGVESEVLRAPVATDLSGSASQRRFGVVGMAKVDTSDEEYYDEESKLTGNARKTGKPAGDMCLSAWKGMTCFCCYLVCLIVIPIVLFVVTPGIAAKAICGKHYKWAESMYTGCEDYGANGTYAYCNDGSKGGLIAPDNGTRYITWAGCRQGYKNDTELESCLTPCINLELLKAIESFNSDPDHGYKLVSFNSRVAADTPTARISAWWLPSGRPNAPRIVVSHGNNANQNGRFPWMAAYLLRSMGFDVLTPSLRNHGLSEKVAPEGWTTWSYGYPMDILGAWDYLVNDPDGVLGGAVDVSRVAVYGFSMGGYVTSAAFGLEGRIPGALIDSAVFNVDAMVYSTLAPYLGTTLNNAIGKLALTKAVDMTGVDILANDPQKVLPNGPDTKRKVLVATSMEDDFVLPINSEKLEAFLKSYPEKYDVSTYYPAVNCNGNAHAAEEMVEPTPDRNELCTFFTSVFGLDVSYCRLDTLPVFPDGNAPMPKVEGQLDSSSSSGSTFLESLWSGSFKHDSLGNGSTYTIGSWGSFMMLWQWVLFCCLCCCCCLIPFCSSLAKSK